MGLVGVEAPNVSRIGNLADLATLRAKRDRPARLGIVTASIAPEEPNAGSASPAQIARCDASANASQVVGRGECLCGGDSALKGAGAKNATESVWSKAEVLTSVQPGAVAQHEDCSFDLAIDTLKGAALKCRYRRHQ